MFCIIIVVVIILTCNYIEAENKRPTQIPVYLKAILLHPKYIYMIENTHFILNKHI